MTVAGINIFLFIAWAIAAYAILGAILSVVTIFIADLIHMIFKEEVKL